MYCEGKTNLFTGDEKIAPKMQIMGLSLRYEKCLQKRILSQVKLTLKTVL